MSTIAPAAVECRTDRVARFAVGLMSLALLIMLGRVAQLQLAPSEQLSRHVQSRVAHIGVAAPRGDLMDRRFRPLGSTRFGYRVFVDPTELPKPPDEAIARLSEVIGAPADELGGKVILAIARNQKLLHAEQQPCPRKGLAELVRSLWTAATPDPAAAVQQSEDRDSDIDSDDAVETRPPRPTRYVRVSNILDDETVDAVKHLKLPGVHLEQRGVRDYPTGSLVPSIVGKVNVDHAGVLGAELSHQAELSGQNGRILYVRDAMGRPLWIGPGSYEQPQRGEDVRLSIDLELQRIATEELQRGVAECDAAGGRMVILDPATGEILAMVDLLRPVPDAVPFPWPDARPTTKGPSVLLYEPAPVIPRARYLVIKPDPNRDRLPALARNRCVEDIYEPGSTFKPFVWATVTELGGYRPTDMLQTGNGYWRTPYGRMIHDVHRHAQLTWRDVLVESSNIGMSQGVERISHDQLSSAVRRLGFGAKTGLGLPGETAGMVTSRKSWRKQTQTSVSFGQEIAVTPVQMVRAFSIFARRGELAGTLPPVRLAAAEGSESDSLIIHRVLRSDIVMQVRDILREVAAQMEAKMAANKDHPESGWRYAIFGKSGTAQIPLGKAPKGKRRPPGMGFYEKQYNASFIGAGPFEDPKLVILVVIDDPGPQLVRENRYYGALTAGPVVRRVMDRSLAYLGVRPSSPGSSPMVLNKDSSSYAD